MKTSDFPPNKKNILTDKEIDYAINLTQADIQFFIRYKGQLKKFAVDNRSQINKANMVKIFSEIERITLHIVNLKNQEQELITLLDKIFYS